MTENYDSYFNPIVDLIEERIGVLKTNSSIKVTFNEPNYNNLNPSIHVWIESWELIGHIALWRNHTGEFSVANFLKDETLFDYSCEIENLAEVSNHVEKVINLFGGLNTGQKT